MKKYTVILTRDVTESVVVRGITAKNFADASVVALAMQNFVSGWEVDDNPPPEAYVTDIEEE